MLASKETMESSLLLICYLNNLQLLSNKFCESWSQMNFLRLNLDQLSSSSSLWSFCCRYLVTTVRCLRVFFTKLDWIPSDWFSIHFLLLLHHPLCEVLIGPMNRNPGMLDSLQALIDVKRLSPETIRTLSLFQSGSTSS